MGENIFHATRFVHVLVSLAGRIAECSTQAEAHCERNLPMKGSFLVLV